MRQDGMRRAGPPGHGRRGRRFAVFLAIGLLTIVAACGKRGDLEPPEGQKQTYPRTYPSR